MQLINFWNFSSLTRSNYNGYLIIGIIIGMALLLYPCCMSSGYNQGIELEDLRETETRETNTTDEDAEEGSDMSSYNRSHQGKGKHDPDDEPLISGLGEIAPSNQRDEAEILFEENDQPGCYFFFAFLGFLMPLFGLAAGLFAMMFTPIESRRRRAGILGFFTAAVSLSVIFVVLYFIHLKGFN